MNKTQRIVFAVSLAVTVSLSADDTKRSCSKEEMEQGKRAAALNGVEADRVSFYEVGLVCSAAPRIGCGTMAKPALLSLTENSRVSGAWLNEAGTRLVIAWRQGAKPLTTDQLDALLDPHGLAVQPVSEAKSKELLTTLADQSRWFDADTVDRLSERESAILAARLVKRLAAKTTVTSERQSRLQAALDQTLRSLLTANRGNENLDIQKLLADVEKQLLLAATPHLDSTALSALKDAIALGYQPLANED